MNKMTKIKAEIIADSINPQGDRITTYLLTFPRFILAELNTHRVFSKNSASSRAIPFEKMVKMVETDPFIPIAFQKHHKGMQGNEYLQGEELEDALDRWNDAKNYAIAHAKDLYNTGTTKQLCNRLLEPFMWHTVLLTGTEFKNFFELRCPQYEDPEGKLYKSRKEYQTKSNWKGSDKWSDLDWLEVTESQAEIHMQALAEAMWDAYNESTPKELKEGEWHIPFGDKIQLAYTDYDFNGIITNEGINKKLKISTARCARLSYMTFDGEIDYEKDLKLHDTLLESHHMSPFEHCARAMSDEEYQSYIKGKLTELNPDRDFNENIEIEEPLHKEKGWCNNFKGFVQYRHLIENNYEQ